MNKRKSKIGGMFAIDRSQTFTQEDAARHSNEARLAWHRMCTGEGTTNDFDVLAMMLNVLHVLSEPLGKEALDVVDAGSAAMIGIKERYIAVKKFGVDATSLRDVPPVLDLYDEFLRVSTPLQMTKALQEAIKRLNRRLYKP